MINLIIDDKEVQVEAGKSVLKAALENGIDIPTLCYLNECSNVGKCGVCAVEIEGKNNLSLSCLTKAEEGMVVRTNTEKVQERVKMRVSMLLDKHEFKCGACPRKENCELLKLVIKTKAKANTPLVIADKTEYIDDRSKSIMIDRSKCVLCGRCVAACKSNSGTGMIEIAGKGQDRKVQAKEGKCFDETNCLLCGQCVAACPVGALNEKTHVDRVKEALEDPDKHVIVAMAPAVRAAMGELFKMPYGTDVTGKIYAAMRELGFDKIFDINFAADVTIMEEATEFISRVKNNGPFPMFTSCCPGWVRQVENYYPQYLDNISSAKSPQQIFGSISKTYYPEISGIKKENVFTVTIMPCTAKKFEADRDEMKIEGVKQIDAVLTTRELAKMIKDAKIKFAALEDQEADPAMGEYTGAGVIFGTTGGVMEAALRTAKDFVEDKDLEVVNYEAVRGLDGIKEATVEIAGEKYNIAVVNGAANLAEFIESGKINEKNYHFIEVMACPGGCVNGGGQPHVNSKDRDKVNIKTVRAKVLYDQDENRAKRKSHKNEAVLKMYKDFMGNPCEGKAHEYLHLKYSK